MANDYGTEELARRMMPESQLVNQLYLQPKIVPVVQAPKAARKYNSVKNGLGRSLPPLEDADGPDRIKKLRSNLQQMSSKPGAAFKDTPYSPKTDLPPLQTNTKTQMGPALRGSTKPTESNPAATGVLFNLPTGDRAGGPKEGKSGNQKARMSSKGTDLFASLPYVKLIYTLREYPNTEDFVYLRRMDLNPSEYDPYALEVVPFAQADPSSFYTMSVRGITRYTDGACTDFATLDQWERELRLFLRLKSLKLFKLYKVWKAFRIWRRAVNQAKLTHARKSLEQNLFLISPVFQSHLIDLHSHCFKIRELRLHALTQGADAAGQDGLMGGDIMGVGISISNNHGHNDDIGLNVNESNGGAGPNANFSTNINGQSSSSASAAAAAASPPKQLGLVYTLDDFVIFHDEHKVKMEDALQAFHAQCFDTVMHACVADLDKLEERLSEFNHKQDDHDPGAGADGGGGMVGGNGGSGGGGGGVNESINNFFHNNNGNNRSNGGHLSFLAKAEAEKQQEIASNDFAYTIAAARRSEQRRLLSFIRLADYVISDSLHTILMQSLREVLLATHPFAIQQRQLELQKSQPQGSLGVVALVHSGALFETELLLADNDYDLIFDPRPDDFLEEVGRFAQGFLSSLCCVSRLYGDEDLTETVMGTRNADLEQGTELQELVATEAYEELVNAVRESVEEAFVLADEHKMVYFRYRDMLQLNVRLNLHMLAPSFKMKEKLMPKEEADPAAAGSGAKDGSGANKSGAAAGSAPAGTGGTGGAGASAPTSTSPAPVTEPPELDPELQVFVAPQVPGVNPGPVTLVTFRQILDILAQQCTEMNALSAFNDVSVIRIALEQLKAALLPSPTECLAAMHRLLPDLAIDLFHGFMNEVQDALTRLQSSSGSVEEYVEKIQFLSTTKEKEKTLDRRCNEIHDLYNLIDDYKITVPAIERAAYSGMDATYNTLKSTMEEVETAKEDNIGKYSATLDAGVESITKEVTEIRNDCQHEMILSENSDPEKVVAFLTGLKDSVDRLNTEFQRINKYQRLFKVSETQNEDLMDTVDEVNLKLQLWQGQQEWTSMTESWCSMMFDALDIATIEETIARFHKAVFKMERGLPPNKLVPRFRATVDDFRLLLPVVGALRNRALKDRHWAKVFEIIGQQLDRESKTFTLQTLLDAKVQHFKDPLMTVSTEATQELALEELLAKVTNKWVDLEFTVLPYKETKDAYILGGVEEVQIALEDSMVTMSTILASRFVTGIRSEVEKVEKQLTLFSDALDEWLAVQKAWMYLEPIFSAVDIQRQLPIEAKAFFAVDKQFKDIMRKTRDRPNALSSGTANGVLETFQKANETLEKIQKNLEDYLETKRMAFPRFYFLSNDELLEILAQTKNVQAVQPHMGKCFDGIRALDFGSDPKSIDIHAMISGEGERVSLGRNTKARGNVEKWLSDVEVAMIQNLKRLAKSACQSFVEEPRAQWVLKQPAQIVIAISQVYWCQGAEDNLRGPDPVQGLVDYRTMNIRQLADLTRLVRGDLSSLHRRILGALITIDVHARDIIDGLVKQKVTDWNDFQWQMQLRYYFENDDVIVRQVNARFVYAYEYLGAQARLVVTPMTDRCYLTLTGALHLKLGGAPAGPAGTGKTETTKDLGKALGVNCVVFNCGDNLDYKFMGKFFSGLAQCGAWACFDEFNRIDIEVLSVVAQQLLTIQNALKGGLSQFNFEGRLIKLVPTCGVFITMNPGYAGRTELPDNLKALFRPMSMMIPDYALVAEVMLFSEGFEDSKTLSRKMVKLYKLSSEQLSQQDHYDFGMRAVKSVLVMAGSLKRANPTLSEDVVLIRAMRDSNLPKFLVEDVELFQNIISDLFPGVVVPDQDYGELELSIRKTLETRGLQQPDSIVTKVIQLYDTMNVRFGVMLVGPTGGGKTECYRTLQGSCTRLRVDLRHPNDKYQIVRTNTFNPKCIKMGELYGEYNLLTNEWTDGLGSSLIREAVADTTQDRKWIVFDGPVDAIWIENMNTVLDDNCTLCLPNGERIKLNPVTMRMLFEVQDLAVASPATVSRCGMVYIALEELGWRPYVKTWSQSLLPQRISWLKIPPSSMGNSNNNNNNNNSTTPTPPTADFWTKYIYSLFDTYVDTGLNWIRKKAREYIPSVDNNLTTSLAQMFESLLSRFSTNSNANSATSSSSSSSPLDATDELKKQAINKVFLFCYCWALGGNLVHSCLDAFDEFAREYLQTLAGIPGNGTVFDYFCDTSRFPPEFKNWSEIVPSFQYRKSVPYFQLQVPTMDTTRFSYLLELCLDVQRSVLFSGVTGVGKSVITLAALDDLRDKKAMLPFTINFSAQSQSIDTQLLIESKLEKKRRTRYGAPVNKRIVFFIDDVNMPAKEKFGAQPPIELLRQFQDFKGFYDRKKLFWKDIEDTVLCAACAPPGGGRQELTPRFTRHFTLLNVPPPSDVSTKMILSAIFGGFLADAFPKDFSTICAPIVSCSVEAYKRISEELLPTPAKSHYTFNLRDLSKVFQGMLMINSAQCSSRETMALLWVHESSRVFHDRLINNEDKEYFKKMLHELATKQGLFSGSYEEMFLTRQIVFCDFLRMGVDREERRYEQAVDIPKMISLLDEYLDEYNLASTNTLNLVFFMDAVEHIARMTRILRQPRGNAMLVGVGGSGKGSLTRLATFMGGFKIFSIELTRGYGSNEFREDLKKLYRTAGVDGDPVVFLFADTQIVTESFLEDINNMLNSGEVPGMFAQDEKDRIVNDVRDWVINTGGNPSKDGCYAAFVNRVRDNLHIVLTMSPVGEAFRARCRQFPSLINCTTIDWFSSWPEDALLSVSQKFLASTDLGADGVKEAIAKMCVKIHQSVGDASDKFFAELRRRYYTTPKSYLDLINLYLKLLREKREALNNDKDRLLNGLNKLNETNQLVDRMKIELADLQPILETKAKATAELLVKVAADQEQAEKVKRVVAAEERDVKAMQADTQVIADSAKADLAEAMPALNAALNSLKALNKNDIVEIKSFPKPPPLVQLTMEAVCILKNEKPDWDTAKKVLSDSSFMRSLEEFDKDNMSDATIKKLQKYMDDPNFTPEGVAKQSNAAKSLCMWVRAMDVYNRVSKVVAPKRAKLAEAEALLESANKKLAEKQAALREVESRVEGLKAALAGAQREQRELNDQADITKKRLERAGKLTSALADEGVRWKATADSIGDQLIRLTGDVFLAAACIAYYGAFTGAYRQDLVASWIQACVEKDIPVSSDSSLRGTLGSPVEIREWNLWGLPSDDVSIDNGILVTRGKRWPLMIDPQGQANVWVKAMESKHGLRCVKLTDGNFLRTLENSIRIGNPVLIEDVGETLDPALEPVLQKAVFKQGGRMLIRLGDSDVDYDPNFRFYVTTKLSNPHYLPEVCIKVTVINFTVTMKGLEDQLLGEVVRMERPDLEEAKDRLVVSISADKKQLAELEDRILKLLKESSGNILDDEQLINTLNHSKLTSGVISNRVAEAEVTEKSINEAREHYRPAATRGSILYFVIADLSLISPMYQFSLSYFTRLFSYCIEKSEKHEDVPTRLQLLSDFVTRFIFNSISRGLFEEHKLLYSFLVCTSLLRHPSSGPEIASSEWNFLTRGASGHAGHHLTNPLPSLISEHAWVAVDSLKHALGDSIPDLPVLIVEEREEWALWLQKLEPHLAPLPKNLDDLLTPFQKLLVIKVLREEKLQFACAHYVSDRLGKEFTEPPPWTLDDVFPDTTSSTPIIFILSTGADPTAMLQRFGEKNGFYTGERLHMISLGQGQGPIAEMLITAAAKAGDWVCLQNCHLASSWMLRLEEKVEELSKEAASSVHPDFRLWLTSMPSKVFPVLVLQNGVKLTNEPPKGVKANMNRTYNDLEPEALNLCPEKPAAYRKLLFALSFFHAVVQERRKFGPLGWNIRYEFNASDQECSAMTLRMFLAEQEQIPWPALEYVVGQVNYGGRVTDDLDRRCLMSILRKYVTPEVLDDAYAFTPSGVYRAPTADASMDQIREYLRGLPPSEAPEVFGMHANANLAFQLQETRKLVETILSIQPRLAGMGGGKSSDEIVGDLAKELELNLPPLLSRDEAQEGLFARTATGQLNSLSVVLGQEMDRFNRLSTAIKTSLVELQKALKGLVVMSGDLEAMYHAMLSNQVPELWNKVAYPSLKPLASWIDDYLNRIKFMRIWLTEGPPKCFWLPGFFFPQGFMTGVLQMHARKYSIPIDALGFGFDVTAAEGAEDVREGPEDGILVNGLWVDGGRWSRKDKCLDDSEPGVMYAPLPVVLFRPQLEMDAPETDYSCPLYKTSVRAGVLSTTGQSTNFVLCVNLPIRKKTNPDYWILQGVALLCMLND